MYSDEIKPSDSAYMQDTTGSFTKSTCNMTTLMEMKDHKRSTTTSYTMPLKLKVIATGEAKDSSFHKGKFKYVGLADTTAAVRISITDQHFDKFTDGSTVMIRNYSCSNGQISINKNTRIYQAPEIMTEDISAEIIQEARNFINPASVRMTIQEAIQDKTMTLKTLTGTVMEVSGKLL